MGSEMCIRDRCGGPRSLYRWNEAMQRIRGELRAELRAIWVVWRAGSPVHALYARAQVRVGAAHMASMKDFRVGVSPPMWIQKVDESMTR